MGGAIQAGPKYAASFFRHEKKVFAFIHGQIVSGKR